MLEGKKQGGMLAHSIHSWGTISELKTRENTLWFMFLRTMVTTLLLIVTLIYQIKDSSVIRPQDLLPIYSLIGFTFFITILFTALMPRIKNTTYLVSSQIIYDVLFVTSLIYITGTQEAVFTFLYLLIIAFASILYLRTGALYTAALCSISFSSLLIFQPIGNSEKHLMTLFFNNVAFFLVAFLTSYLAKQFSEFRVKLKEEQESVKELEDLNKVIVNQINSGLVTTDTHNQIIFFNKSAERITGLTFSQVYKKNIFDVFKNLKRHWIQKAPTSKEKISIRNKFTFKKDTAGELLLGYAIKPLKDSHNEKIGTILIFEDLTKIIEMEQHLQRSDKLAAIGKLAAGIAHEIRNPLASVSGSIEMLSRELDVKDENKRLMHIVMKETDRLNSLVNEFLEYVRPEDQKAEPMKINEILSDTITAISMDKTNKQKIDIQFHPEDKNLNIPGNKEKIKQVFWNLLLNAKQSMPAGGNIHIRTLTENSDLKIEISDEGEGISEAHIQKIFDPFFTTKSKGTGLGLSMVHKIIDAHKGRITVQSRPKKGTLFSILLPIGR